MILEHIYNEWRLLEQRMAAGQPDPVKQKMFQFFRDNPEAEDDEVHDYAEEIGMDPDDLEEIIYRLIGDFAGYGLANEKGFTEKDADPQQLARGIEVEMEHTRCKMLAKRIALDHLAEIPDYYTRLDKMEKEAEMKESLREFIESIVLTEASACQKKGKKGPIIRTIKIGAGKPVSEAKYTVIKGEGKKPLRFKTGQLHRDLGVPVGEKIPADKKAAALAGKYGPKVKKRAVFAFRGALAAGRKTAQRK